VAKILRTQDVETILKYQKMASSATRPMFSSIETEIMAIEESFDGKNTD
jgi:hypothetical protein